MTVFDRMEKCINIITSTSSSFSSHRSSLGPQQKFSTGVSVDISQENRVALDTREKSLCRAGFT